MSKFKEKLTKFWAWLRKTIINKEMLLAFLIAEIIFWSPCIILAILAETINPWFWTAFTAVVIFWSAPLTPGWALQIALAIFLKKHIDRLSKKYIRIDKLRLDKVMLEKIEKLNKDKNNKNKQ